MFPAFQCIIQLRRMNQIPPWTSCGYRTLQRSQSGVADVYGKRRALCMREPACLSSPAVVLHKIWTLQLLVLLNFEDLLIPKLEKFAHLLIIRLFSVSTQTRNFAHGLLRCQCTFDLTCSVPSLSKVGCKQAVDFCIEFYETSHVRHLARENGLVHCEILHKRIIIVPIPWINHQGYMGKTVRCYTRKIAPCFCNRHVHV